MDITKVGIIGAGLFGTVHARTYADIPYVALRAVCDISRERAEALARAYGTPDTSVYTSIDEMVKKCDCDFIAIATPDHLHAEAVIAAANAKRDILVEKPFGTTRDDLLRMREAIARNGVRAMCDLHNRMSPPFTNAKNVLDSGELGQIQSMYIRLNDNKSVATDMLAWSSESSILWFLGSHSLDALMFLCNSRPADVFVRQKQGVLKALGVDTVDLYQTSIGFENGCIAQMENGWITPNGNSSIIDLKCNVLCERGMVDINTSNSDMLRVTSEARVTTPDCIARPVVHGHMAGFANNSIRSFVDRLRDGKPFMISVDEAVDGCLALLSILESGRTGKLVSVRYE